MIPTVWTTGEVAVVGLGRTGVAVTRWLLDRNVRVYASDRADRPDLQSATGTLQRGGAAVELGRHDLDRIGRAEAVIVSPGVPPEAPALVAARARGVPVLAELNLAACQLDDAATVVVTGTNGKTTTSALVGHMLGRTGLRVDVAGNIGRPLIETASRDDELDWIVIEASSFQLHDAPDLDPTIGVLTNLAPDHLDRYPNLHAYYDDKRRLFQHASPASVWVLNGDDGAVTELAARVVGVRWQWSLTDRLDAWWDHDADRLMVGDDVAVDRERLRLMGDHNVHNALAAALVARAIGLTPAEIGAGLSSFRALPHRLEPVREVDGVQWINDSKATNVASAVVALAAMTGPFVWLAGGLNKGEELAPLRDALARCRSAVFFGEAADRFVAELGGTVTCTRVADLPEAVAAARDGTRTGDTVLLSPACASFDQFRDYEERGDIFREMVNAL